MHGPVDGTETRRTKEQVKRTRQAAAAETLGWGVLEAVVAGLAAFGFAANGMMPAAILAGIVAFSCLSVNIVKLSATVLFNAQTEGKLQLPADGSERNRDVVRKMCSEYGVEEPELSCSRASDFEAAYVPNLNTISFGENLWRYDTDASLGAIIHETAHHVMITASETASKWVPRLRAAGTFKLIAGLMFTVAFAQAAYMMLTGTLTSLEAFLSEASFYITAGICCQILYKGFILEHELATNQLARQTFADEPEIAELADDEEDVFSPLKMGENTYKVSFACWCLIGLGYSAMLGAMDGYTASAALTALGDGVSAF